MAKLQHSPGGGEGAGLSQGGGGAWHHGAALGGNDLARYGAAAFAHGRNRTALRRDLVGDGAQYDREAIF